MNWNQRVRRTHRTLAITFVVTLIVTVVAMALQGPMWTAYLPLPPLAVLLFSGLYLFVLPYAGTRRDRRAGKTVSEKVPAPRVRSSVPWVRKLHRWAAAAFTVAVLVTSAALAMQGPIWVSYLPLLPLALLLLSGLSMLVRPRATGQAGTHEVHSGTTGQLASRHEHSPTPR
ncbi:hypothetical protein [Nocardia sp. NPDC051750]|uniref:hypothetical protein n=1 Tax=Nocardia sp. NPDC051750 TaxID=3364325 RepID=UPI0037A87E9D